MTGPLLTGRTVLVTGAARGLGAAIAKTCIGHGASVVLADLLHDELAATVAAMGPNASAHHLDVTDPDSWRQIADTFRRGSGRPDVLVNNAGIVRASTLLEATYEELQQTLAVNVGGTFLGMKAYLDLHTELGGDRRGSIVNIASVRGLIGGARSATYSASKFGIRGLTKAAAVELGPLGIRVNSVCPGPIETDMSVGNPQFAAMDWDAYVARLPLGHLGQPVDIGEAVAWLGSDASAFITGIDLPVDGGLTATSYSVESLRSPAGD